MNNKNAKTILLVEDEVLIAMTEKMHLEKHGYRVHHVTTGEKAVEIFNTNELPIDLILMDIDLGSGIDGTQAAEAILQEKDLPIVFLSSHTEPEIVEKTEKITSYGYVVKNSGIVVLDASIKMALKLFDAKTKQKLAEETIKEKERWLSEIARIAHVGGWKIDLNGNTLEWTDETYQIHELPIGNPPNVAEAIQFYHEEDRLRVSEAVQQAVENGEGFDFDARIITAKQNLKWVRSIGYTSLHEGRMVFVRGTVQDITDRKQAEEALRETTQRFQALLDHSPALVHIFDEEGRYLLVGEATAEAMGLPREEIIGKTFADLLPPETVATFMRRVERLKKDRAVLFVEDQIPVKGEERFLESLLFPLSEEDGVTTYAAIATDITARKQAEEKLRESEKRFHTVSELVSDYAYAVHVEEDGSLTIEWATEGFTQDTGLELTRKIADAHNNLAIYPDDAPILRQRVQTLLSNQEDVSEYRIVTASGEVRWLRDYGRPIWDEAAGRVVRIIGAAQDTTARKRAEEEIKRQLSEKETLLREVHHRIKNNIASIEGLLSLRADSTDNADVKTALQEAIARIQSTRILYEKLLISKAYQDISIKHYIDGLVDSLVAVFPESKNISIEKNIVDFTVSSKKAIPLGMIINELMTNIFKYAFKEKDTGNVIIEVKKTENHVTLTIKDNGVGIEERTDANTSPGFGLTIVNMLVEQLHGTYRVANENGTKSVLQFDI